MLTDEAAEVGRVREEKRREDKRRKRRQEKRRSEKKKRRERVRRRKIKLREQVDKSRRYVLSNALWLRTVEE
jgi:hypothetical protein